MKNLLALTRTLAFLISRLEKSIPSFPLLRIPPEKHRELAVRSAEEGISLNQLIASRL
jgi:HicB family